MVFTGLEGKQYRYLVMIFGSTNGPTFSVTMIYDLKSHWDALVTECGVIIDHYTNFFIIINDILMFSNNEDIIFKYLETILEISRKYKISWKLEKCKFFVDRLEFVGTGRYFQKTAAALRNQNLLY